MLNENESKQVNRLYREALEKFVALPFDLVADNWRWKVFAGQVNSKNWNEEWWMLR
jgi:peptidyl-dipeptidase A